MRSIPTRYGGTNFRSRLEARWAAMFDLLDWRWDYEPVDLSGYIPDFVLGFPSPLLVEVKPAFTESERAAPRTKIETSGWSGDALILGAVLGPASALDCDTPHPGPCQAIGEVTQGGVIVSGTGWNPAAVSARKGLINTIMSFQCYLTGLSEGGCVRILACTELSRLWREAGNEVQWNRR